MKSTYKIAIIGLGYVGLPLAVAFNKHYQTIGYDINQKRVDELNDNRDSTNEITQEQLQNSNLVFTTKIESIADATIYIVTVPTPVDSNNLPDLTSLKSASNAIAGILKKNDIVVYESTVYPGATEQICAEVLERVSGLQLNHDFFIGYSPERINPGDKVHTLKSIVKVVSASSNEIATVLKEIYTKIIDAGVFVAKSIQVAEAAKAIENTQRDINIAFMNELAAMFNHMGIDTLDVIETAATKWNFLPFKPGLVGGHCIGVDPYYLIHNSQENGYFPQLITTARRINEKMSDYVVNRFLKKLALSKIHVVNANILIMGITFKENCPDLRNTRVVEIIRELTNFHANVDVFDTWANESQVMELYGLSLQEKLMSEKYNAIILAVAHDDIKNIGVKKLRQYLKNDGIIFDLKGILPANDVDERL